MEQLILFDLDGTLTRTQNGHAPFNEAIFETFGMVGDIRSVIPDGNTDPQIVREIFAKTNVELGMYDRQWEQFAKSLQRSYSRALRERDDDGSCSSRRAGIARGAFGKRGVWSRRGHRQFRGDGAN